jgi:hypothetical protein
MAIHKKTLYVAEQKHNKIHAFHVKSGKYKGVKVTLGHHYQPVEQLLMTDDEEIPTSAYPS